jgi:YggT family protein
VALVGLILLFVLRIFFILLIARLVLDYVQMFARSWQPRGVMLVIAEVVYSVTDPPLRALRRVIPPLRLGGISLDLSFLVLSIAVVMSMSLVAWVFFA